MKIHVAVLIGYACSYWLPAHAQTPQIRGVPRQMGPSTGELGSVAEIRIPSGYCFVGPKGLPAFAKVSDNVFDDGGLGIVGPASLAWFIAFSYKEDGYVRDDDKDSLKQPLRRVSRRMAAAVEG